MNSTEWSDRPMDRETVLEKQVAGRIGLIEGNRYEG